VRCRSSHNSRRPDRAAHPIVIHEGAAASPSLSITGDACFVCHFFEGAVAVVVEPVFSVVRDVKVVPAVVVVVADTTRLDPSRWRVDQPSLLRR